MIDYLFYAMPSRLFRGSWYCSPQSVFIYLHEHCFCNVYCLNISTPPSSKESDQVGTELWDIKNCHPKYSTLTENVSRYCLLLFSFFYLLINYNYIIICNYLKFILRSMCSINLIFHFILVPCASYLLSVHDYLVHLVSINLFLSCSFSVFQFIFAMFEV